MTGPNDPPRAAGQRLQWHDLPAPKRAEIEAFLGEPVTTAHSMASGFSPGLAARLVTASGRRVFAKAVSATPNEIAPRFHRREIQVASRLPASAPAPRLLWSSAEADGDGWVTLLYEDVAGRPPAQPWLPAELDEVIDALNALTASLTPSPIPPGEIDRVDRWGVLSGLHWHAFRIGSVEPSDPWIARHLDRLVDAEGEMRLVIDGDTLLHLDLRGDNLLLTERGVVVVDWPHARIGAPWLDGIFLAPSVAMEGGPQPEELIARLDATRSADPEHLTLGIIAMAGFFSHMGAQPPEPGLPGLRVFQEAQAAVARRWVAARTGWR